MFWACFGHHSDMFWASFGHVLGIIRTCFGHHLGMFRASSGHVLGIIRRCFGHHPDTFRMHFLILLTNFLKKWKTFFFQNFYFFKNLKNHQKSTKRDQQYPTGAYPTRGGPGAASPQELYPPVWGLLLG